jgi:hypothetical protein
MTFNLSFKTSLEGEAIGEAEEEADIVNLLRILI